MKRQLLVKAMVLGAVACSISATSIAAHVEGQDKSPMVKWTRGSKTRGDRLPLDGSYRHSCGDRYGKY